MNVEQFTPTSPEERTAHAGPDQRQVVFVRSTGFQFDPLHQRWHYEITMELADKTRLRAYTKKPHDTKGLSVPCSIESLVNELGLVPQSAVFIPPVHDLFPTESR